MISFSVHPCLTQSRASHFWCPFISMADCYFVNNVILLRNISWPAASACWQMVKCMWTALQVSEVPGVPISLHGWSFMKNAVCRGSVVFIERTVCFIKGFCTCRCSLLVFRMPAFVLYEQITLVSFMLHWQKFTFPYCHEIRSLLAYTWEAHWPQ